ncbi:hypothetical protein G7Z17_g3061 [Cylindrodendrum hubeiense]|uniref:SNF2 N-terminal domain-containing protein n=1 Tax=Cylindrodendrum hubeiense TaxID=595255 RepID=A0A9P5HLW2_9HYPO|nr:hypothetical protein G7Z17_g3061 [Cylindrodendrum hubeiense]
MKRKLPTRDANKTRSLQPLTPRHKRPPPLLALRRSAEVVTPSPYTTPLEAPNSPEKDSYELGEVLFGTLKDIQVLLKWEPKSTNLATIPARTLVSGEIVRDFAFDINNEYCLVKIGNGEAVGVLEARALRALGNLVRDDSPIRYDAFMPESEWQDSVLAMTTHIRKAKPINVQVNVIGPRYKAKEVSRGLGNAKLFLQSPAGWGILPYENPQCLDLPLPVPKEIPQEQGAIFQMHQDPKIGTGEPDQSDGQHDANEEGDSFDPVRILNGINQHEFSGAVEINSQITTKLHLYQKKGVEFILRRESGQLLPSQTLWEPLNPEQSTVGYRHAITGAKSRTEEDSPGGILADDMGLGKSLMMIAAILSSNDRAEQYICQKDFGSGEGSRQNHRPIITTKATLIVVLSEPHTIRNWSTKQFSAVNDIPAHIRWCMTGTPIQNGLEDLGSLVRHLRVPILADIGTFRRHIGGTGSAKTFKQNLPNLQLLLRSICLQRTQALLGLRSTTQVLRLEFLEHERKKYLAMQAECKKAIDMAVSVKGSHQSILVKLLRLREYCNGIEITSTNSPDAIFSIMEQSDHKTDQEPPLSYPSKLLCLLEDVKMHINEEKWLNDLSVASRVHLLEPQWNPSVERQAIGRVIRLGQEREVKIIRYIMSGSIEELKSGSAE